jgi:hypothetical protein
VRAEFSEGKFRLEERNERKQDVYVAAKRLRFASVRCEKAFRSGVFGLWKSFSNCQIR